jgi:hypothetical protein
MRPLHGDLLDDGNARDDPSAFLRERGRAAARQGKDDPLFHVLSLSTA